MWMMPAGFLFVGGERKAMQPSCTEPNTNPTPLIQRAKKEYKGREDKRAKERE